MLHSEGGYFRAHLTFPKEYPQRPPKMKFVTDIWHPNGMYVSVGISKRWLQYIRLSDALIISETLEIGNIFKH